MKEDERGKCLGLLPKRIMIRPTADAASWAERTRGVLGTFLPSLLASTVALYWRASTHVENGGE